MEEKVLQLAHLLDFDDIDIKILHENFDIDLINQIDLNNVIKILDYLNENGVYYAKDILLTSLDLFLFDSAVFISKFEHLKKTIGENFVDELGEDCSLIEIMYE